MLAVGGKAASKGFTSLKYTHTKSTAYLERANHPYLENERISQYESPYVNHCSVYLSKKDFGHVNLEEKQIQLSGGVEYLEDTLFISNYVKKNPRLH